MPRKASKSFEQRIWDEAINPFASGEWIDNVITQARLHPNAPFADSGEILQRAIDAGLSREDIGRLCRHASYETAFSLLNMLGEDSLLTKRGDGMHEGILGADPSGMEGRPGSWPIPPEQKTRSAGPLAIPRGGEVFFSPDSTSFLVARTTISSGTIQIWSSEEKKMLRDFDSLPNIRGVCWSPDCARIAVSSHLGHTCMHDAVTGKMIWKRKTSSETNSMVRFTSDGTELLWCGHDKILRTLNAADGREVANLPMDGMHFAYAPWAEIVAIEDRKDAASFAIWNLSKAITVARIPQTPPDYYPHLEFLPYTTNLLFASYRNLVIADISGSVLTSYVIDRLGNFALAPDGKMVATIRADGMLDILETMTGKQLGRAPGEFKGVYNLDFSPNGRQLALGGWRKSFVFELSEIMSRAS